MTVGQMLANAVITADENERAFAIFLDVLEGGGHNHTRPVIAAHGVERDCYRLGHAGRPPDVVGFSV